MLRNSQLTQLVRDVPLEVGPADLRPVPWDREQIHQLFDTLQFRVLRDRLYSTLPNGIGVPAPRLAARRPRRPRSTPPPCCSGPTRWPIGSTGTPQARAGLAWRRAVSWGRGTGSLTGLAIAGPGGTAAFIDPTRLTESDDKALGAWLADPDRPKALHDAKGPMHALAARGFELRGLTSDTALAAYLALPGQRSFDLADLALRYLNRELRDAEPASGQLTLDVADESEAATALAQRAQATAELADALDQDLADRGATELLADVELPLVGGAGRDGAGRDRRGLRAFRRRCRTSSAAR